MTRLALVCAFFLSWSDAVGETLTGPARVVDGDTLVIGETAIRLEGIDAPETAQTCERDGRVWTCGEVASNALQGFIGVAPVRCVGEARDPYDRLLADCFSGDHNIAAWMVRGGWAVVFEKFSDRYLPEQRQARARGRGLWDSAFETPWDFRSRLWAEAAEAAPRPDCPIKGNISPRGRIYHTPYSRWYARTRINTAKGERWFCDEAEALAAGWRAPIR